MSYLLPNIPLTDAFNRMRTILEKANGSKFANGKKTNGRIQEALATLYNLPSWHTLTANIESQVSDIPYFVEDWGKNTALDTNPVTVMVLKEIERLLMEHEDAFYKTYMASENLYYDNDVVEVSDWVVTIHDSLDGKQTEKLRQGLLANHNFDNVDLDVIESMIIRDIKGLSFNARIDKVVRYAFQELVKDTFLQFANVLERHDISMDGSYKQFCVQLWAVRGHIF